MPEQSTPEDGSFRLSRETSSSFESDDSSHSSGYYESDDQENSELPSDSDEDDASGDEVDDDDVELALQILAQMEEQEEKRRVGSEEKKQGSAELNEGTNGPAKTPTLQKIGVDTQEDDIDENPCSVTSPISLIITSIEKAAEEARRMEIQVTKTGAEDERSVDFVDDGDGCSEAKEVDESTTLSISPDDVSKELQQNEDPKREEPKAQQIDLFEDDMRNIGDNVAGEKSAELQNDEQSETNDLFEDDMRNKGGNVAGEKSAELQNDEQSESNDETSKKRAEALEGKDINTDISCTEEEGEVLNKADQQEGFGTTGSSDAKTDHHAIADETKARQCPDTEEIESDQSSDFEEAVEAEAEPQTGTEEAERELYHDAVADEDEQNATEHEDSSNEMHQEKCKETNSKADEEPFAECKATTEDNIDVRYEEEVDDEDNTNVAEEAREGDAFGDASEENPKQNLMQVDLTEAHSYSRDEPCVEVDMNAQKNTEEACHGGSKTGQSEVTPSVTDEGAGESYGKNTRESNCMDEMQEDSTLEITSVAPTEGSSKVSSAILKDKEKAINSSGGETIEDEPRHEVEGENSDGDLGAPDMVTTNADSIEEDHKDKEAGEKPTKGGDMTDEIEGDEFEGAADAEAIHETHEHASESTTRNDTAAEGQYLDKGNETEVPLVKVLTKEDDGQLATNDAKPHLKINEAKKNATSESDYANDVKRGVKCFSMTEKTCGEIPSNSGQSANVAESIGSNSKLSNEVVATKQAPRDDITKSDVICTDSSEATERTSNVHEIELLDNIEAQDTGVEDNIEASDQALNEAKRVQQVGQALIDSTKSSKHQPKLWWNNDEGQDVSGDVTDEAVNANNSPLLKKDEGQANLQNKNHLDAENVLSCEDTRNEKDASDSMQVENSARDVPAQINSPDSPLKEILVNTEERGDDSQEKLSEETTKVLSPTNVKKVKFRDPFICPPPPPAPRSSREIVNTHSKPSVPQDIKWKKPSAQLEELIGAANGPSLSRRSHACGTLKVLSTSKKNRRILARTTGILDALAFVAKENVEADSKAAIEARTRAVITIVHLSIPVENRVIMMRNANVLESLVIVIREDRGEPRALACSALAYLAKTDENRFALINVPFLLNALAETVGKVGERNDRIQDTNGDKSTASCESSEVADDKYAVKTQVDNAKRKKKEASQATDNEAFIARSNACAVLIHLAKDCASLEFLARHELLMDTLAEVATEFDVAIHTRCIEVICHLTRFPSNARHLATKKKVLDTLVTCTKSVVKEDRVWAARGLQNITSDKDSKVNLAKAPLLNALCMSAMSSDREEQLASLSALLNLSGDPGTITNLTNTKFVVSTLINLAHNISSSSDVRLIACDCLAAIGLWLQTLAGSGPVPEGIDEEVLPTHTATGWQRWE